MRLRQLSRKLEVSSDKIIKLLSEAGHELENDANSKLSDEQVEIVSDHFAPLEPETQEPEPEEVIEEINEVEETPVAELEVPLAPPSDITHQVSKEPEESKIKLSEPPSTGRLFKAIEDEEEDPNVELIKAPKIELEGLKVVGKIDLPEPKKPEPKEEPDEKPKEEARERREPRRDRGKKVNPRGRNRKPRLNPIEYQRQKEEREAQRKKREQAKKLKEKRKQHYMKQVKNKPVAQKEKATPIDDTPSEAPILYQTESKKPKEVKKQGALRRFWGWLNGEYDQF